jgi:hypothetical protein
MVKKTLSFCFFVFVLVSPSWFNKRKREIKVCSIVSFSFNFNELEKELKIYSGGVFFVPFNESEKEIKVYSIGVFLCLFTSLKKM